MAAVLSDQARVFLREHHFAVCSTVNKDGSSQLTLVAYVLDDDETIVMNVELQSQKAKNMQRDPRIALCGQDGNRDVSVSGTMTFLDDQQIIRRDLERLVERFLPGDEETRQQYVAHLLEHPRVSLRFPCEKMTEFLG